MTWLDVRNAVYFWAFLVLMTLFVLLPVVGFSCLDEDPCDYSTDPICGLEDL